MCVCRRPVKAGSWVALTAKIDKVEGRKLFMTAEMTDERGNVLADSTTLFVSPKQRGLLSLPFIQKLYIKYFL